jgi:hypothetical protein
MVLAGRGITSKSDSAESSSALIIMFCFALDGCPRLLRRRSLEVDMALNRPEKKAEVIFDDVVWRPVVYTRRDDWFLTSFLRFRE